MLFSKQLIAPSIDTDCFDPDSRFVDIASIRDDRTYTNRDGVMLRLFVLSCTMGGSSAHVARTVSNSSYNGSKRPKTAQSTSYNRYFLVADLENPPQCAAILPRSVIETSHLLSYLNGRPFVGVPFSSAEPYPATQTLGDHLPILPLHRSPFIPLRSISEHLESTESRMAMPRNSGETNYFILTNKSIVLHGIMVCPVQTCLGVQCDRQKGKAGCSCLHSTNHNSSVYEMDVEFPVPTTIIQSNKTPNTTTSCGFRSLSTTKLFFQNYDNYCTHHTALDQERNRISLRKRFKNIVDFINENGGWTIVGWFMMGSVVEAAAVSNEKIQNYEITIHLSYVYPSNAETILQSDDYKQLLIST